MRASCKHGNESGFYEHGEGTGGIVCLFERTFATQRKCALES